MESDSAVHSDGHDGAEVSPLAENQAADTVGEISGVNVSSHIESDAIGESG